MSLASVASNSPKAVRDRPAHKTYPIRINARGTLHAQQQPYDLGHGSVALNSPKSVRKRSVRPAHKTYPIRTNAGGTVSEQQQPYYLGPGSFRSRSRFWVDHNPRSRENVMRDELTRLLGSSFHKVRPDFLLNPSTGHRLELDAYCESLQLAAEFHGHQHFVFPNAFHDDRAKFESQQQRDRLKVELCERHGVTLIVVSDAVTREGMREHLQDELKTRGIKWVEPSTNKKETIQHHNSTA